MTEGRVAALARWRAVRAWQLAGRATGPARRSSPSVRDRLSAHPRAANRRVPGDRRRQQPAGLPVAAGGISGYWHAGPGCTRAGEGGTGVPASPGRCVGRLSRAAGLLAGRGTDDGAPAGNAEGGDGAAGRIRRTPPGRGPVDAAIDAPQNRRGSDLLRPYPGERQARGAPAAHTRRQRSRPGHAAGKVVLVISGPPGPPCVEEIRRCSACIDDCNHAGWRSWRSMSARRSRPCANSSPTSRSSSRC